MNTYYVATTGNDSNPGTLAAPKLTIAAGKALLSPGDRLYIRGGTYDERVVISDTSLNGSSGAPTIIAGYPGETATIFPSTTGGTAVIDIQAGSWIKFQHLIVDGSNQINQNHACATGGTTSHIELDDLELKNSSLLQLSSTVGAGLKLDGSFHWIHHCRLHDNGLKPGVDPGVEAPYGCYFTASDSVFEYNQVYGNGSFGMQMYPTPSRNTVRYNSFFDNHAVTISGGSDAALVVYGDDNLIYNNLLYRTTATSKGHDGLTIAAGDGKKALNNTVYGFVGGQGIFIWGTSNAVVQNNIAFGNTTNIFDEGTSTGLTLDHNLTSDPFFLSSSDFHLDTGSPAIDAGTDVSGHGVTNDFDGIPRPVNSVFDIGAYEYFSLSAPPPDSPVLTPQRGSLTLTGRTPVFGNPVMTPGTGVLALSGKAPLGFGVIDPGSELFVLVENPRSYTIRIREARIGANGIIEIEGVREDISIYDSVSQSPGPLLGALVQSGSPAPEPTPIQDNQSDNSRPGSTRLVLLDVPQLRSVDTGPGFYAAANGTSPGWNGAILHEKIGADWVQIAELGQRAVIGQATTELFSGPVTDFDETGRTYVYDDTNTVEVTLIESSQALSSVADADLEVGINAAAIGVDGRWEIIAFGTATQLGEGRYRLSHLLRGLKGTEWAIGTHNIGDQFVLLNESLRRVSDTYPDLNVARSFRGVTIGTLLEDTSTQSFTDNGISLKPLSPVFIRGEEDANENRTLHCYRRSRYDGLAGRDGVDPPPLDEPNLVLEWDIRNSLGTVVLRTLTSTTESVAYTAAQQVADFGSVPASLNVCVYQISTNRGRGYSGCAVISSFDSADVPGELLDLVVEEADGDPSVPHVTRIQFDQDAGFTVTEAAAGVVVVSLTASPGGGGGAPPIFRPFMNEPPAANFATLDTRNARPVLDFDGSTDEEAIFSGVLPSSYAGGGLTVATWWSFTSATSGSFRVQAAIERCNVSSLDIDAESFAAFQSAGGTAPGTSGQIVRVDVTFTDGSQMDSLAAGEMFRVKIRRDADGTSGTDDITTDAELLMAMVMES